MAKALEAETLKIFVLLGGVCLSFSSAALDWDYSGFGSVVAGRVLSGERVPSSGLAVNGYPGPSYMADYVNVGIYESDWSLRPESLLGAQAKANVSENLSFVGQATVRAIRSTELDLDSLYVSYRFMPAWRIQLGRKRLPLFYYSDYYDVGHAYPWVRAPELAYSWQVSSYNGINFLYEGFYEGALGSWDTTMNLYYGEEKHSNDKLLRFFTLSKTQEHWLNMTGLNLGAANEWLDFRLTWMANDLERKVQGQAWLYAEQEFRGATIKAEYANFTVLYEVQHVQRKQLSSKRVMDIKLLSASYRWQQFSPFISYNEFVSRPAEDHHTASVGLRWDLNSQVALKTQYDHYIDRGASPIGGDARMISFAVDFVF